MFAVKSNRARAAPPGPSDRLETRPEVKPLVIDKHGRTKTNANYSRLQTIEQQKHGAAQTVVGHIAPNRMKAASSLITKVFSPDCLVKVAGHFGNVKTHLWLRRAQGIISGYFVKAGIRTYKYVFFMIYDICSFMFTDAHCVSLILKDVH